MKKPVSPRIGIVTNSSTSYNLLTIFVRTKLGFPWCLSLHDLSVVQRIISDRCFRLVYFGPNLQLELSGDYEGRETVTLAGQSNPYN